MDYKTFNGRTIRAVLFDFDGTLRHSRPEAHNFFFDQAVRYGAVENPGDRRAALRWAHAYWIDKGEILEDIEAFGMDTPEFWLNHSRKYLLAFGCEPDQAEALAPMMRDYMHEHYKPHDVIDESAPAVLQALGDAGYTVGVVSNREFPFEGLLDELGLLPHVEFTLAAGQVKSWKPDARIFHHALELAGVEAGEAAYIGDNFYADVVGSRNAGLHPVLFDPGGLFPEAECHTVPDIEAVGKLFL